MNVSRVDMATLEPIVAKASANFISHEGRQGVKEQLYERKDGESRQDRVRQGVEIGQMALKRVRSDVPSVGDART